MPFIVVSFLLSISLYYSLGGNPFSLATLDIQLHDTYIVIPNLLVTAAFFVVIYGWIVTLRMILFRNGRRFLYGILSVLLLIALCYLLISLQMFLGFSEFVEANETLIDRKADYNIMYFILGTVFIILSLLISSIYKIFKVKNP